MTFPKFSSFCDSNIKIKLVYEAAEKRRVKVVTAAEFAERKIEMLEALRKELYAKYGEETFKGKKRTLKE